MAETSLNRTPSTPPSKIIRSLGMISIKRGIRGIMNYSGGDGCLHKGKHACRGRGQNLQGAMSTGEYGIMAYGTITFFHEKREKTGFMKNMSIMTL